MRHTISVLVENKFGVLTRIAGLFSGRGYNIDTLNVAPTQDAAISRMTLVTRGADLFAASHVHRTLQALLRLPVPRWHHHPLLLDETGEKLAKRRGSPALAERREEGADGRMLAKQLRVQYLSLGT